MSPHIGSATARRLLAAFGLPHAIFQQPAEALEQLVPAAGVRALLEEPPGLAELLDSTWRWLQETPKAGRHHIVTLGAADYPADLLTTEDPPLMLYLAGRIPDTWPASIAVVGSRNPTAQGLENARSFSRSLAQAGLTVVSGLALGVDGAAHEGALEGAAPGQLATIAVVGTGLDRVYPKRHLDLAHRIAQRGVLVSEYFLGTPPLAENFPKRNRIISGLSQGTLVVEGAIKSGSLITAKQAAEQGREVFAIPGSIHSPQSHGCHALIKQGAKLVESAQDVLEELPSTKDGARAARSHASGADDASSGTRSGDTLLDALGFEPVGLDALVARTGCSPAELQARLLEFELEGEVARLPGGLFQRVGSA